MSFGLPGPAVSRTLREEFVESVRTGVPHVCDVRRGAEVQGIVDQRRASAAIR
jgi:hypothetical protein